MTQKAKNWLSSIGKVVITAVIIAVLSYSFNFYIDTVKYQTAEITKQLVIKEQLEINKNAIEYANARIILYKADNDSLIKQNSSEHNTLSDNIKLLQHDINTLTYVVSKYNKNISLEIKQLKHLQLYGKDIVDNKYNKLFKEADATFTQKYN